MPPRLYVRVISLVVLVVSLVAAVAVASCGGGGSAGPSAPSVAPPTLSSISPSIGSNNGGALVTISGGNFHGAMKVTFGGAAATNVVVIDSTSLTAVTPAHAAGKVDVTVTNPEGGTTTSSQAFEYLLTITSCQFINGIWKLHGVGTGSLTGQVIDVDLDFSETGTGQITGTMTVHNPSQSCVALPWTVTGTFSHSNNSVAFSAVSKACANLTTQFTGALDFPACTSGSGTGVELEGKDETFTWTMTR